MSGAGDVAFLQDQVQRLNEQLAAYQRSFGTLDDAFLQDMSTEAKPWLLSKELLSPLMVEYDRKLAQQRAELDSLKTTIEQLRARASAIVEENRSLAASTLPEAGGAGVPSGLAAAREQVALLTRENDILIGQNTALQTHNQALQRELQAKLGENALLAAEIAQLRSRPPPAPPATIIVAGPSSSPQGNTFGYQPDPTRAVSIDPSSPPPSQPAPAPPHSSLRALHNQLRQAEADHQHALQQLGKEQQAQRAMEARLADAIARVKGLEETGEEMAQSVAQGSRDAEDLRAERDAIRQKMLLLEDKLTAAGEKQLRCHEQVRESVALADQARLERDQMAERAKHFEKMVADVRAESARQAAAADTDHFTKMEELRAGHDSKLRELLAELSARDAMVASARFELERAVREKRDAEQTLAAQRSAPLEELAGLRAAYDQVRGELAAAQRARDEAQLRADLARGQHAGCGTAAQAAAEKHALQTSQLQQRAASLEQEVRSLRQDLARAQAQIAAHHGEMKEARNSRENLERQMTVEVGVLQRSLDMHKAEAAARMTAAEDAHRREVARLQKMLASAPVQLVMEGEHRRAIDRLTHELQAVQAMHAEAEEQLRTAEADIEDYQVLVAQRDEAMAALQTRLRDAEQRAARARVAVEESTLESEEHARRAGMLRRERDEMEQRCRRAERALAAAQGGMGENGS